MLVLVVLIVTYTVAGKNEIKWLQEYQQFEKAKNLINQQQPSQALPLLSQLLEKDKYKNSVPVVWAYGICLAMNGDFQGSKNYLYRTQQLRPLVLFDYIYTVQYGETLYRLGDYKEAKKYLSLSKELNPNGQFAQHIMDMLNDMESKL